MNTFNKETSLYIEIASKEAIKSPLRCKHGCVIVKYGKIIAKGFNNYRGYNKYGTCLYNQRRTIHAENAAINNCGDRNKLQNADLYIIRYDPISNEICFSAPCHNCIQLIISCMKKYRLRNVYYSIDITMK